MNTIKEMRMSIEASPDENQQQKLTESLLENNYDKFRLLTANYESNCEV